jgi:phenylalanyl-tRNA synthetase beta chain
VLENIDKKCAVAFFEIMTEKFAKVAAGKNSYAEPSKFPAIDIDLTFNADIPEVDFAALKAAAENAVGSSLADVKAKDIYTAEDGATALTLRFTFVSNEKTLSKQELTPAIDALLSALAPLGLTMKA